MALRVAVPTGGVTMIESVVASACVIVARMIADRIVPAPLRASESWAKVLCVTRLSVADHVPVVVGVACVTMMKSVAPTGITAVGLNVTLPAVVVLAVPTTVGLL